MTKYIFITGGVVPAWQRDYGTSWAGLKQEV